MNSDQTETNGLSLRTSDIRKEWTALLYDLINRVANSVSPSQPRLSNLLLDILSSLQNFSTNHADSRVAEFTIHDQAVPPVITATINPGFFDAPASTGYHHGYNSGFYAHVMEFFNTADSLWDGSHKSPFMEPLKTWLSQELSEQEDSPLTPEQNRTAFLVIVLWYAVFHDAYKVLDRYNTKITLDTEIVQDVIDGKVPLLHVFTQGFLKDLPLASLNYWAYKKDGKESYLPVNATNIKAVYDSWPVSSQKPPEFLLNAIFAAEGGWAKDPPRDTTVLSKFLYLLDEISGNIIAPISECYLNPIPQAKAHQRTKLHW